MNDLERQLRELMARGRFPMKKLFMISVAALATATILVEDTAARSRVRRPRIVVYAEPRYDSEPGAIYGYAPGYYRPGPNGMLYGPYPLGLNAPIAGPCCY
jgi:hypothetical protein